MNYNVKIILSFSSIHQILSCVGESKFFELMLMKLLSCVSTTMDRDSKIGLECGDDGVG